VCIDSAFEGTVATPSRVKTERGNTAGNITRMSVMKRVMKTAVITVAGFLAALATSQAQVQQSFSVSLTLYNQTDTGIRTVRVSTRDIIENLVGTNVPGGKLWLVMPSDPSPDGSGNIGAFLRVTDSHNNILAESDSSMFNIYQTVQSQTPTRTVAFNQFSFDFGGFGAELYGTATWSKSASGAGGQGSFHCSVGGRAGLGGITNGEGPCSGSVSGGSPRPAQ
jgi:hypothetical protein